MQIQETAKNGEQIFPLKTTVILTNILIPPQSSSHCKMKHCLMMFNEMPAGKHMNHLFQQNKTRCVWHTCFKGCLWLACSMQICRNFHPVVIVLILQLRFNYLAGDLGLGRASKSIRQYQVTWQIHDRNCSFGLNYPRGMDVAGGGQVPIQEVPIQNVLRSFDFLLKFPFAML